MYKSLYSYITPEGQARQEIDKNLTKAGWIVQDKNQKEFSCNITAGIKEINHAINDLRFYIASNGRKP